MSAATPPLPLASGLRGPLRMLIYSQDGFGLGHLRRNLNIAIQLLRRVPASVLILADSPAAPFFRLPRSCDFVKIPTLVKVNTGIWESDRLRLEHRDLLTIRSAMIRDIAMTFRPHLFLVDHMPYGVSRELQLALETLKSHRRGETVAILGLRDILGAPKDIRRQWDQDDAFAATAIHYDRVCIYGSQDLFPLLDAYGFPPEVTCKAHYCGYVSREHVSIDGAKPIAPNEEPLILVTGGGGADSSFFIDKFMDAARILAGRFRFRAIVSTGPFLHADQYVLIHSKARRLPIRVTRDGQDSIRLLRQADLVISMAGYNTISEILRFRKRAIVIPRPGPSAEQTMRTRIMSERGLFRTIHPHDLTAEGLADAIQVELTRRDSSDPPAMPALHGASQAASIMVDAVLQGVNGNGNGSEVLR